MPHVFQHTPLPADVWDMQGALIYFGSAAPATMDQNAYTPANSTSYAPIIALSVQLSFQRGIAKRYPINVRRVIYTLGHPEGQASFGVLFGPGQSMYAFVDKFSAVGTGTQNSGSTITIKPFGTVNQPAAGQNVQSNLGFGAWTITDPVVQGINLTLQESRGADIPVTGGVTMTFTGLKIEDQTSGVVNGIKNAIKNAISAVTP